VQAVNQTIQRQDACGIYIDADNSGGDTDLEGRQLYVMVPGNGKWTGRQDGNPALNLGDTEVSGVEGTYRITGDRIVYEWAIPLFDSFPEKPTDIAAGKTIGFDILVADADHEETANFVTWSPETGKSRTSDLYGELVFIESYRELGHVEGRLLDIQDRIPIQEASLEIRKEGILVNRLTTGPQGGFTMKLMPGDYTLRAGRGQGFIPSEDLEFSVKSGKKNRADLSVSIIKLPDLVEQCLARYKSMKSYRDTVNLETRLVRPGMDNRMTSEVSLDYMKPLHVRIQNVPGSSGQHLELWSNERELIFYNKLWKQYRQKKAASRIPPDFLQGIQNSFTRDIILAEDPRKAFMNGLEGIESEGTGDMNQTTTAIFSLKKLYGSMGGFMPGPGISDDYVITIRLWIGSDDRLVKKMSYTVDMARVVNYLPEEERADMRNVFKDMKITMTEIHRGIEIDPAFSADHFDFVSPQGASLVERFTPPGRSGSQTSPLLGNPAPGFRLKDLDGMEVDLKSLQGQVVLIDFWATWCGPCVSSMPHIQELSDKYQDAGLVVLGINAWERDPGQVRPFLEKHGISYRVLLDSDNRVIGDYGVSGIPSFFLIDRKGVVRYASTGFSQDPEVMIRELDKLLDE
jgi:peroxiredoxin